MRRNSETERVAGKVTSKSLNAIEVGNTHKNDSCEPDKITDAGDDTSATAVL